MQIGSEEKSQLIECFNSLAFELDLDPLPCEIASKLAEHLLGKTEFNGIVGKEMAAGLNSRLVTQKECATFLAGHAATKIQSFHGVSIKDYSVSGPLFNEFYSFVRSITN